MDRDSTIILCILLFLGINLFGGCLGEKAEAATGIKYVCSDGSIVSESRECRTEEKAGACDQKCPVPVEKACICNQTCPEDILLTQDTGELEAPTGNALPAEQNTSPSINVTVSSGPCVSLGCPPDAKFVGNSETKKFHTCDCSYAAKISPKKRVCFTSAKYAESQGYVPCGFCKPSDDPKT